MYFCKFYFNEKKLMISYSIKFSNRPCRTNNRIKLLCNPSGTLQLIFNILLFLNHIFFFINSGCGKRAPEFESKNSYVIGGIPSKVGQWPWMAYLRIKVNRSYYSYCVASIINNNWILSSAHCLKY